ncbi:MAG: MFS transporter [Planctomycetota bacterium]
MDEATEEHAFSTNKPKTTRRTVHEVAPEDRVPTGQKFAYAMGVVSDHFAQFAINAFLMPFFNLALGMSPALIGIAQGIARLWDAINDPLIGSISDHWKGRWGRRRPFIFVGAFAIGIVFPMVWLVPTSWDDRSLMIWLIIALLCYYTAYSLLSVPYESLGIELTPDYQERTNVFTLRSYVVQIFDFGIHWLLPLATFFATGMATEQIAGEPLVEGTEAFAERLKELTQLRLADAIPYLAIGVGAMIVVTGIIPAIFCVERYAGVARTQRSENPLKSIWSLLQNGPFLIAMGSIAIFLFGVTTTGSFGLYVHAYYIYDSDIEAAAYLGGVHSTVNLAFGLVGAAVIHRLSKFIDKKPLLIGCVVVMLLSTLAMIWTYQPGRPWLTLVQRPTLAIASTGFWVLIISMRADVGDWDEFVNGRRREGVIAALGNWLVKLAITLATVAGGVLLEYYIGFDVELRGDQAEGTLPKLKWSFIAIQTAGICVVLVLLMLYPLTRERLQDVRQQLEARRSKV